MHILIPCKNLDNGKSRLAECLDAAGRRALCEQLLKQTLERAITLIDTSRIRLVTSDPRALEIAARCAIAGLTDSGEGLNAALETARAAVFAAAGNDLSLLVLPIDLPYASPEALAKALSCDGDVVIAPDQNMTGTNLLLLRGAALRQMPFVFGTASYPAHFAAARARNLNVTIVTDWRIACDLDEPAQYAAWLGRSLNRHGQKAPSDTLSG